MSSEHSDKTNLAFLRLGKVVNFGPDEDLILGSLMSHPHYTGLLDDAKRESVF